jgi:hypothetical protein
MTIAALEWRMDTSPTLWSITSLFVIGVVLSLPLAIVAAYLSIFDRLLVRMRTSAEEFISRHGLIPLIEVPILVVRGSADEATGALTAVQFSRWITRHIRSAAIVLAVPLAIWMGLRDVHETFVWYNLREKAFHIGLMTLFLAAFAAVCATGIYVSARLLAAAALGWDMIPQAFAIDGVVESIPPGRSAAEQTTVLRPRTMAHSIYDDPVAAEAIANWIAQRSDEWAHRHLSDQAPA